MEINSITASFSLIIIGLIGVIIALCLAYQRALFQLTHGGHGKHGKEKLLDQPTFTQAEQILSEAREVALSTIQEATKKAQHMAAANTAMAEEQKQLVQKMIKEAAGNELDLYKEVLKKSQQQLTDAAAEVIDQLQRSGETELTKLRQDVSKATAETQSLFVKQLQAELAESAESVAAYKAGLLAKAEQQMFEVVKNITQEVLHKTLTKTEHEALVIEALAEAKQHHVI